MLSSRLICRSSKKKYRTDGVGNSAFNPSMMVALLIYSYCTGERSSRRIEKHCQTDVAYKVITANQSPDHSTISRFRKNNESYLKGLFLEILRLCSEAGLVKLGKVSLDGTKIKANASLAANRKLKHLEQEIDKMLSEATAKDAEEDKAFGSDSEQNTINIEKINNGCMRTRELSHLAQTATDLTVGFENYCATGSTFKAKQKLTPAKNGVKETV